MIRDARADDGEEIARIQHRSWQVGYAHIFPAEQLAAPHIDPERWRARLVEPPPGWRTFVADRALRVAGFACTGTNRDDATIGELYALYVDPDAWGDGIGRELIAHAEEALRPYGEATLWVLEDNPRARRFYEAAGWTLDEGVAKTDTFLETEVVEVRYRKRF